MLILEGCNFQAFILGTISVPSQFLVDSSGQLVENPAFLAHNQQEKLLAYWLFST